jgi:thiamine pyrophosphate-dependent acetolactate synthase large subunit-like protein
MTRYECLELLAPLITDHLVVTSQSGQRIEWASLKDHDGNLLIGSMGNALGVGIGLALALPHRKVLVLESDGSMLLSLFNLATLANVNPPNVKVFVFDNEAYSGTRISYPTATAKRTDLAAMARGAGIDRAVTVRDIESFKREGVEPFGADGLRFVVCKVEESLVHRKIPRPNMDTFENKYRFVRYLERTEGKPFFKGRG